MRPFTPCVVACLTLTFVGCVPDASRLAPSSESIAFNTGVAAGLSSGEFAHFATEAIFDRIPNTNGSHAPTIAALPDGELLCAWYSYTGPHELTGSAIYMARRPAGATAWRAPSLHVDRPIGDGNPVLYAEGENLWLFQAVVPFGWSTANVVVQRSFDRGKTWGDARPLGSLLGTNVRNPPIRLRSGELLLPAYTDLVPQSEFYVSTDGDTWSQRSAIDPLPAAVQPSVAELTNGGVLAVMRNHGGNWLWVAASDNAGVSWTAPQDAGFINLDNPAVLTRLASGRLALVFDNDPTRRGALSVALSPDEGATWTQPRVLVDAEGEIAYPSVAQAPDGLIHVVYSHDRRWIGHVEFNESWILQASASP